MIRCLAALLTFVFLSLPASADESLADVEAIDNVVGRLDAAFAARDVETMKTLTTRDHIAVVPYSNSPERRGTLLETLPGLEIKQTDPSEPTVVMLGPDSAMRTLTAKFEGSFDGEPIDYKVYITSIMTKKDGKWLESFYQVTPLAP